MADDLQTLRRNVDQFPREITARLRAVAWRTSRSVQAKAKSILRSKTHGTGKTADSIVVIEEADKKQFLVAVENPDNPNLGLWLERGTVHMQARPFMRPAADEHDAAYKKEMEAVATKTATELLT